MEKLIAASPVKLAYEEDQPTRLPLIDEDVIRFNAVEQAHETFLLGRVSRGFEFCKTAEKPYDRVVCAILACASEHSEGAVRVSSDGDAREWAPHLTWASEILGRPVTSPLKPKR